MKKETLKVSPLLKYRIPKYPAHDGEDPLNPDKRYASKTGYYTAALFGAIGLFSFTNGASNPPGENPIQFKDLGFPHTYASYGTGLPSRLDRETAVKIIDSIFNKNGIDLTKEVPFSENGIEFNVTGYNKESKVGYVWLDHTNTSDDCYNSWRSSYYRDEELLPDDLVEMEKIQLKTKEDKLYRAKQEFYEELNMRDGYYQLLKLRKHSWGNDELQIEIAEYLSNNPDKTNSDYGSEILDRFGDDVVDIREMKEIVNAKDFSIGAFSVYSEASAYRYGHNEKKQAIKKLSNLVQDYIDWGKTQGRF
jgi:hypothetical protein